MNRIPTTDLYFLNSCGHRISSWLKPGPVRKLGHNSFVIRDTRLLIRRDTDAIMADLLNGKGKLIYLIDDDIEGATLSPSLPEDYRKRLMDFHARFHGQLTRRAETLVVTSPALLERFSWHADVRLLHPIWHLPMADNSHFTSIEQGGAIKAVHLGSASHGDGLVFLRPVLAELLEQHEQLHFTYISPQPLLERLDNHPRVKRSRPRRWSGYRKWIAGQRFHIGLYPLPDTPFHNARSRNKILEYGVVGALGVYPGHWKAAQDIREHAVLCRSAQRDWTRALSDILSHPHKMGAMRKEACTVLDQLNDPTAQRLLWAELLKVNFD